MTATYDRVIATCSVHTVPYAWVAQTRPGSIILTPWGTTFENSALLRLTVNNNGEEAVGRIGGLGHIHARARARPAIPDESENFDTMPISPRPTSTSQASSARTPDSASVCTCLTAD